MNKTHYCQSEGQSCTHDSMTTSASGYYNTDYDPFRLNISPSYTYCTGICQSKSLTITVKKEQTEVVIDATNYPLEDIEKIIKAIL